MQLKLVDALLFTTIRLTYQGSTIEINDVLIGTGSATTVLAADASQVVQALMNGLLLRGSK